MQFKLAPWPSGHEDNTDAAGLEAIHAEVARVLADFEGAVSTIQVNFRLTETQRGVEVERIRRTAIAEFNDTQKDIRSEVQHFERRRSELQRDEFPSSELASRYCEAREALRSLADSKRKSVLKEGLEQRADLLLRSILDGRAGYLVGLTQEGYSSFVEQAKDALFGDELRAFDEVLDLAGELAERIDQAGAFVTEFSPELADIAELSE